MPLRMLTILGLALVATNSQPLTAAAASPADRSDLRFAIESAERDMEIAKIRADRYVRVDYPLEVRKLEGQIKLTQAELEIWKKRVEEYQRITELTESNVMLITLDEARLSVLRLTLTLDDLQEEKLLVTRQHGQQRRLFELEAAAAHSRLAQLRRQLSAASAD